jgi:hypothetical protein
LGAQIKEVAMDGAYCIYGETEIYTKFMVGKPEGKTEAQTRKIKLKEIIIERE